MSPPRGRMAPRDPGEAHRVATPLELLFDLCFVVAVAQASAHLHHGLTEGHVGASILGDALVFFAIWWAWMNFTWFASAYDADDVPYRLAVLVQIAGGLVLAAGVPRAFEDRDFTVATAGYAIMRVGLVALWLRAAGGDPAGHRTAVRYAIGLVLCQLGWLGLLALPPGRWLAGWVVLAPAELLVPVWAERAGATPWHPHHIAERFGLLEITPTILFSMWWIYFAVPAHRLLVGRRAAFIWATATWWSSLPRPRWAPGWAPPRTTRSAAPICRGRPRSRRSRCRSPSISGACGSS